MDQTTLTRVTSVQNVSATRLLRLIEKQWPLPVHLPFTSPAVLWRA